MGRFNHCRRAVALLGIFSGGLAIAQPVAPESAAGLTVGVLVELAAAHADNDGFGGAEASDLSLATVAFSLDAVLGAGIGLRFSTLYEEHDTPWDVDEAIFTLAPPDSPLTLKAGQLYVPFSPFATHLVSDPLTLELAEARELAVVLGFAQAGFALEAYAYDGDLTVQAADAPAALGFHAQLAQGDETEGWGLGLSYTTQLADSDGLTGVLDAAGVPALRTEIAGFGLDFALQRGPFNLIAEYVTALDRFAPEELAYQTRGAQPAAWNLEVGYRWMLGGRAAQLALAHQRSHEAFALGLPQTRWAAALGLELSETLALGLELAQDEDYDPDAGGTGTRNTVFTAQLAFEL